MRPKPLRSAVALATGAAVAFTLVRGGPALADEASPPPVEAALAEVSAEAGFRAPSRADMSAARRAFGAMFDGDPADGAAALRDLGFAVRPVTLARGTATAVSDPPGDVTGRGFYLLPGPAAGQTPVLLQAPHRFKDLDTGAILADLAATGAFGAAAWNTVPRWAPDDRRDRRSDVAHIDVSYFNAFTRAFAERYPAGTVIQLHGFAKAHRRSEAGRRADVIVSSGTAHLHGPARRLRDCLARHLAGRVLGYGEDVFELGATTNHNAAMLRTIGFDRFVHLELARDLRRSLLADGQMRQRLKRCLLEAAG